MRIKEAVRRAWEKVKRFFGADVRTGVPEPLTMPEMPEVKPPKLNMPEIPEPDMSEIEAKRQAIREEFEALRPSLEAATKEMAEAFAAMAPVLEEVIHNVREVMESISMTEKQKAEAEAWRRYYRERARASNNYRRMHGMPMVHRPRGRGGRIKKPPDNLSMRLAELKEQTDRYAAGAEGQGRDQKDSAGCS